MISRLSQSVEGFSLLELLIVLALVSLLYSITSISLIRTTSSPSEQSLQQLSQVIRGLRNEAVIRSTVLAIRFDQQGYELMESITPKQWQLAKFGKQTRYTYAQGVQIDLQLEGVSVVLPKQSSSDLKVGGSSQQDTSLLPQVIIFPTGEMTPFKVIWREDNQVQEYHWDGLGRQHVAS